MSCAYIADKSWYIKVPGLFRGYGIEYISLKIRDFKLNSPLKTSTYSNEYIQFD